MKLSQIIKNLQYQLDTYGEADVVLNTCSPDGEPIVYENIFFERNTLDGKEEVRLMSFPY